MFGVGRVRHEAEVGELVVQQEAAPRHRHAGAAGRLDRERVRDRVAPLVDDREVRRRDVLGVGPLGGGDSLAAARVERRGGDRLDRRDIGVDLAGPRVGEVLAEQGLGRHVHERRVADIRVAVGEGVGRRLEVEVQALPGVLGRQVEVLEDVERLADGRAARRRRRHAVDVESAVLHVRRILLEHLVVGEVVRRHEARERGQRRCPDRLRVLHDRGDLVGDAGPRRTRRFRAARSARSVLARSRFVKVDPTSGGASFGRNSSAVSGKAANRAWLATVCWAKVSSTRNPRVASRIDGFSISLQRLRAEPVEGRLPRGERAGHADRESRGHGVGERIPHAERLRVGHAPRNDERVARHLGRCRLASVDRGDLAGRGVEVDEVPAAADARAVGFRDAERRGGGDRGIYGIAALAKHLEADRAGFGVDG